MRNRIDAERAIFLYTAGLSAGRVAKSLGCTRAGVFAVLKRHDVPRRSNLRFGKDNHFYRGGPSETGHTTETGYVRVHIGNGKRRYQHRLVMERVLGRPLLPSEAVHHRNGDRADNRPENLELMSHAEHTRLHKTGNKWSDAQRRKNRKSRSGRYSRPEITIERVAQMVGAGMSVNAIAKRLGCNWETVMRRLRQGHPGPCQPAEAA